MKPIRMKRNGAAKMDWAAIHRRLELSRNAIENLTEPDQSRRDQILRERAVILAKAPTATRATLSAQPMVSSGQCIDVIAFASAGERYAFETAYVAQVYPICPITHIPGTPNFVVGIVPLQGGVLSVIDLRSFLNLPLTGLAEPTAIIVLQGEMMEFGVLADEILGIVRYPKDSVERDLSALVRTEHTYLKGVSTDRTAILDANQLLSDPRLVVEIS
jgi:purine-binding chemotaxis protein CheW